TALMREVIHILVLWKYLHSGASTMTDHCANPDPTPGMALTGLPISKVTPRIHQMLHRVSDPIMNDWPGMDRGK
ncbi:hypothetical protein EV401DRAFT_2012255, partial [Pisolithus croceorrhizus]